MQGADEFSIARPKKDSDCFQKIWDPRRWEAALARVAALVAAAVAAGDVSVPAPAFLRADPVCAAVWR